MPRTIAALIARTRSRWNLHARYCAKANLAELGGFVAPGTIAVSETRAASGQGSIACPRTRSMRRATLGIVRHAG